MTVAPNVPNSFHVKASRVSSSERDPCSALGKAKHSPSNKKGAPLEPRHVYACKFVNDICCVCPSRHFSRSKSELPSQTRRTSVFPQAQSRFFVTKLSGFDRLEHAEDARKIRERSQNVLRVQISNIIPLVFLCSRLRLIYLEIWAVLDSSVTVSHHCWLP